MLTHYALCHVLMLKWMSWRFRGILSLFAMRDRSLGLQSWPTLASLMTRSAGQFATAE